MSNWQEKIDEAHKGQTGFFRQIENTQKHKMKGIYIPDSDLPNPLEGSNYEKAREYFFNPYRLKDENNGKKGEEYHRSETIYLILDSSNPDDQKVLNSTKKSIAPMFNQYRSEHNRNSNLELLVVYEKRGELSEEKKYNPIIRMPLVKSYVFWNMK